MNNYMNIAKNQAAYGVRNNEGGPFGAVIVDKEGNVIASANNQVLKNNDPTAHAEVQCIRQACKKLGTYDLKGYTLYTTCEPCPMCLSAIIWANIEEVYYACTKDDAGKIGFKDDKIYDYFNGENAGLINLKKTNREECIDLFENYKKAEKTIY